MKDGLKYKIFASICFVFVMALSFVFVFIGKHYDFQDTAFAYRVQGNTAYWIFKCICLAWLLIEVVGLWVSNKPFSKYLPVTILGILVQVIPAFMRMGYNPLGANGGEFRDHPYIAIVIIMALVLFIFLAAGALLSLSHGKFAKDEDRAGHSSNYQG